MPRGGNISEKSQTDKDEDKYPSVSVAYDLAVKAYEFGERRLQVVETRNEKILGFTSSLNLVLIAFLSTSSPQNLKFSSLLFIVAFLSGIVSLLVGIVVMLSGEVAPIDIAKIYES